MNIYIHELRISMKSAVIWTCSLIALAALYFSVYPGILNDADDFKRMMSNYPQPLLAALSISLDSITSLLGYYGMIISFITLCGAIQAMNLGMSVISRETRERTADFLLVKPVSRTKIVSAKLLAALTLLIGTNVIYYAAVSAIASIVSASDYSIKIFFMVSVTLFFVQLIFLSIGFFVSVFFKKLKSVLPLSLGIVFGLYFIGALLATGENDAARFISPFKYFSASYIIANSAFEAQYLAAGAVIMVSAITAGYIIYAKKDIHSVT